MFVADLSQRLAERFEVTVLAPGAAGAAGRERWLELDVRRYRYGWPASTQLLANGAILPNIRSNRWLLAQAPPLVAAQLVAAWRLARSERFDAIHAHWLLPQGAVAAALKRSFGIPVLTTAHGADVYALRSPLIQPWKRWALRASDAITAVSAELRTAMVPLGVNEDRVQVIPMGIDTTRFHPDAASPALRERLAGGGPLLVFVGRLAEKKGTRYAIDALATILGAHPTARLAIVGDGPERSALEAQAVSLGVASRITFVGAVPHSELPGYYASADVSLAPSIVAGDGDTEAFGLVVGEAMASGCAVVASRVGGISEVLSDGETGLMVPSKEPAALAAAVVRLLGDPSLRARLSSAGTLDARERLDERRIGAAYSELLGDLVERAA